MYNAFKMNKKIKYFLVLSIIVILSLTVYFFLNRKENDTPPKENLVLLNTKSPYSKNSAPINPTLGIIFNFNATLNTSPILVSVTPFTPFDVERLESDHKSLIVRPLKDWEYRTKYTIIIKKGLLSEDGKKELDSDYNYTFELNEPPDDIIQMPPPH